MPVYNGETYLAEAIDSILSQTFADFELILVDDASRDASADICREYVARDKRLRFVQLEQNVGAGGARNRGIAAASGDYIVFMDCDDVSLPQRLQNQVAFLDANPDIGLLGVCGHLTSSDTRTVLHTFDLPQMHCLIALDMFVGVGIIYSTLMLRQELLRSIGGFEKGRRHGEDRELPWRLLFEKKAKSANLQDYLVLYRRHDGSTSLNRDASQLAETAEVLTHMLRQVWGEAPRDALARFRKLGRYQKLSWAERRAAKRDVQRLIESLIANELVQGTDRQILLAYMNQRIEGAMPRRWQMLLHWRRHRARRLWTALKASN